MPESTTAAAFDLARTAAVGGDAPGLFRADGIELRELPGVAQVRLQALRRDVERLATELDDRLPFVANRADGDDPWLLWRAPGDWLVYSLESSATELDRWIDARLGDAAAPSPLFGADVSSATALFELSGPRAAELLLRDCPLDLEGGALPPGGCAATVMAQMTVVLHRPLAGELYRLFVDRSAARHFWAWLVDSAERRPAPHGSSER